MSGTTLTIPNVTLATTTDSTVPNAVYTAIIYSTRGVPLYTFLSDFYVDQYSLQVPAESAAIVTGAGTTSAIGVYTERGTFGGKTYYNLVGEPDSTTDSAIVWFEGGSEWLMTNAAGLDLYTTSLIIPPTDANYPWGSIWTISNGSAPAPTVEEYPVILSSTWEQLTIENQGTVPRVQPLNEYLTATQTEQLINARIGDGTTPYAAELIAGKTELSVDPDIASRPIAIGINDPNWEAIISATYLAAYGCNQAGLDAALAAIGLTQTQLIVTCPVNVTTNTVIPTNVLLTIESHGSFSVNGGVTLTIKSMIPPTSYQVFSGSGDVIFGENAVPYLDIAWWAGQSPTIAPISNADHAFAQAKTSLGLGNGPLHVGAGVWKITNFIIPNDSIIQGVGSSTSAGDKTVIQIQNTNPSVLPKAVMRVAEDFRNVVVRDLTISVGSATTASCFICSGSVPNSGINLTFDNVTFHGTADTSKPQFYIFDADSAHAWECTNVRWYNCQWATPENTKSIHCDTVNSTFLLADPQVNNDTGSIFWYGEYTGWVEVLGSASFRGVSGLTPTATNDRTIKATISVGTKNATVTTGSVSVNDIGQQVIFDDGVHTQVNNITGITSATAFTVETNATFTFTTADAEINYYSPDPDGAYAVWHLVHAHNTIQIDHSVDEGYQYYLVNDSSDNNSPMNVNGGIIQSIVQFNGAMVLNVTGCRMVSQLFEDPNGIQATLNLYANSMSSTNIWGVTLLESRPWGINNGSSMTPVNFDYGFNGGTFAALNRQYVGVPTWFLQDTNHPGTLDTPLVGVYAADITTGGPHKALIAWGRTEPTSEIPDYYYYLARDYDTGFALYIGVQTEPNKGHQFDHTVYSDATFAGSTVAATITTNEGNYTPGGSQMFLRLTMNADWTMSGLGLTGTSLVAKLDGEMHQIWNVGTPHKLTLLHENAGSAAANRFHTDTGGPIALYPDEGALLWYDSHCQTTGRWRVSKLSITGVTSTGTEIDLALPVSTDDTLDVAGDANFQSDLTVGAGEDFSVTLQPSSSNTGVVTLGNPGSCVVDINEAADAISVLSSDITLTGAVGVTGDFTGDGEIKSTGATGVGYGTGAGGAVTQGTSRTTAVSINKICGSITLFSTNGSATPSSFTVNNTTVDATDTIIVNQKSGTDKYIILVTAVGTDSFQITNYTTGGTTSEAPVFSFTVLKSVTS